MIIQTALCLPHNTYSHDAHTEQPYTVRRDNLAIRCHPEQDAFSFESGSSQKLFLASPQGDFPATVTSGLLIRDLNLWLDFYEAAL